MACPLTRSGTPTTSKLVESGMTYRPAHFGTQAELAGCWWRRFARFTTVLRPIVCLTFCRRSDAVYWFKPTTARVTATRLLPLGQYSVCNYRPNFDQLLLQLLAAFQLNIISSRSANGASLHSLAKRTTFRQPGTCVGYCSLIHIVNLPDAVSSLGRAYDGGGATPVA